MLNAVAHHVASIVHDKSEQQVNAYFGIDREFTKEEVDMVKAKYPGLFV